MKLQLLNSSKIKIFFNLTDLEENNITLHSFLSGSQASKKFFKAIFEIAEEDFGINFQNQFFSYETFCLNFSNFIIIISFFEKTFFPNYNFKRCNENIDNIKSSNFSSFKFIDNSLLTSISNNSIYYVFNDLNDFFEFSNYLQDYTKEFKIDSTLYEYKNIFILEIITTKLSNIESNHLLLVLSETTNALNISEKLISHIKEFSKIYFHHNALDI